MLEIFATLPTSGSFYSYLKRESDGLFYDTDDDTFKSFASLVDGKIEFTEDSDIPGEYSWSLDVEDGTYIVYTKQASTDANAAVAQRIVLKFGQEVVEAKVINDNSNTIDIEVIDDEILI